MDQPRTRRRQDNWKSIRFELAGTSAYPKGSASRIYLLRLPLDEDSLIEKRVLRLNPELATVHRYWPNEPDMFGHVVRTPQGWAISYEPSEGGDETIVPLATHPIREGNQITLTEPDGRRLPFHVVSVRPMS